MHIYGFVMNGHLCSISVQLYVTGSVYVTSAHLLIMLRGTWRDVLVQHSSPISRRQSSSFSLLGKAYKVFSCIVNILKLCYCISSLCGVGGGVGLGCAFTPIQSCCPSLWNLETIKRQIRKWMEWEQGDPSPLNSNIQPPCGENSA